MLHRKFIDLHTHSSASDGTNSPAELVRQAARAGLAAVALTDHDTLSGLPEAQEEGRRLGLEVIRGCELSTCTDRGEMHILGLWLPQHAAVLEERLEDIRRKRDTRNGRMVDKLRALGIAITLEDVRREARGESVGRPHMAAALVRQGVVPDMTAAFREYLGAGAQAYVPREIMAPEEAVRLLAGLGATVSIAHPLQARHPDGWLEQWVERLAPCGLHALEACHSDHSEAATRQCLELARHFGLAVTGGSDYHGRNKPRIHLGTGYGGLRVPLSLLDDLLAQRRRLHLPVPDRPATPSCA